MDSGFLRFDNSYAALPERFFVKQPPQAWASPQLLLLNAPLAELLGADPAALRAEEGVRYLAGNATPPGAEPLAMAYAGHQFGGFSPQLGDGRALLLGEVVGRDGVRRDVQLKGSGRTPFSRMGDGRAALGPALREYIVSEAMAALGAPTTRALAVVATGEPVLREQPLPGAVLTRVATSHVRVGTFEYFGARRDQAGVQTLADYVIARHFPELRSAENPYLALLSAVIDRQAALVAQWMALGFIHGVMNTDNTSVVGETIDYGPCAFMDRYHPETVFSSIDQFGRYAYVNQPKIAPWNLARFAESLLPLLGADREAQISAAQAMIDASKARFDAAYLDAFRLKFGFATPRADDAATIDALLRQMQEGGADFTNAFRALSGGPDAVRAAFDDARAADALLEIWDARLAHEPEAGDALRARLKAVNPAVIPRNHQVEAALAAAVTGDPGELGDLGPAKALIEALRDPYADRAPDDPYLKPPAPSEVVQATFCGT